MTETVKLIIALVISYMIGSISSSIIICKIMTGTDIRSYASGNAGATNALRVLGKKAGIITLLCDSLKAVIAILISMLIVKDNNLGIYASGVGAVLGHNFPLWFGFKGGKGVVVSITAIMFADWRIGLIAIIVSVLIMAITKYVSLGSVIGAMLIIVLSLIVRFNELYYIIFTLILGLLAIYRHKTNIKRLIKGEENKLSFNKK